MDKLRIHAYLWFMIARLMTILAMLAVIVMTTVSAGYAARMSADPAMEHMTKAGHMLQDAAMAHSVDPDMTACEDSGQAGMAESEMCKFLCAGLTVFLAVPLPVAGHWRGPAYHARPNLAQPAGHVPGLDERPPRTILL